jgi:hypothetical protein
MMYSYPPAGFPGYPYPFHGMMPGAPMLPQHAPAAEGKTKRRRKNKHAKAEGAPKKPATSFVMFSNAQRETVKQEHPGLNFIDVGKKLGLVARSSCLRPLFAAVAPLHCAQRGNRVSPTRQQLGCQTSCAGCPAALLQSLMRARPPDSSGMQGNVARNGSRNQEGVGGAGDNSEGRLPRAKETLAGGALSTNRCGCVLLLQLMAQRANCGVLYCCLAGPARV